MKIATEMLIDLYNEADQMYKSLRSFHTRVVDAGLDETGTSQGVRSALFTINQSLDDLDRRIKFSKED